MSKEVTGVRVYFRGDTPAHVSQTFDGATTFAVRGAGELIVRDGQKDVAIFSSGTWVYAERLFN